MELSPNVSCPVGSRLRYFTGGWEYVLGYCNETWRIANVNFDGSMMWATVIIEHIDIGERFTVAPDRIVQPASTTVAASDGKVSTPPVRSGLAPTIKVTSAGMVYETDYSAEQWRFTLLTVYGSGRATVLLRLQNRVSNDFITVAPTIVKASGQGASVRPDAATPRWPVNPMADAVIHRRAGWVYMTRHSNMRWRVASIVYNGSRGSVVLTLQNLKSGARIEVTPVAIFAP